MFWAWNIKVLQVGPFIVLWSRATSILTSKCTQHVLFYSHISCTVHYYHTLGKNAVCVCCVLGILDNLLAKLPLCAWTSRCCLRHTEKCTLWLLNRVNAAQAQLVPLPCSSQRHADIMSRFCHLPVSILYVYFCYFDRKHWNWGCPEILTLLITP